MKRYMRIVGRTSATVFIVCAFAFWVWALSPWARSENPTRLDDHVFPEWANQRCARTQAAIGTLTSPRQVDSLQQYAQLISESTGEVVSLVKDLRARASDLSTTTTGRGPADADLVNSWLSDWNVYISDRRAHETKLWAADDSAQDRDLRFLMSDIMSGGVYTERMESFARINDMSSCTVPGDI